MMRWPQVVNGVRGASQGVLRGCGRQGRLLAHNLVGFCGGLGLGWWLTFGRPQLGLVGLWVGILVGVAVVGECGGWRGWYGCVELGRGCVDPLCLLPAGYIATHWLKITHY